MINLLPWRQMRRAQVTKKRWIYGISSALLIGFIAILMTSLTHRQVLPYPNEQVTEKVLYQEQQTTTIAKMGEQTLDSLHYIGSLKDSSKTWALISQSNGAVSIVLPGDYLGKEHGQVVHIKENVIEIEKPIWNKQGLNRKCISLFLR